MATLLLHPGVHRPGRNMNGLLPVPCVPEGSCSLPDPWMELIGGEIGTGGPPAAGPLFTQIANVPRAHGTRAGHVAPRLMPLTEQRPPPSLRTIPMPRQRRRHSLP